MCNMNEFYEFHRINRRDFATMVHVPYASLMKYESGRRVSEETRLRIEIGMQIMEDYAIRFHDKSRLAPNSDWGKTLRNENSYMYDVFKRHFDRVILVEL